MKKILAILLVVCFAATAAFCAFSVSAAGTNLALGKSYTGAEPSKHPNNANYTAKLTDGEVADKLQFEEGVWFAFYHNASADADLINAPDGVATFVIDLEKVSSIESVRIHFFTGSNAGILPPSSVKVAVSADNTNFTDFGAEKTYTAPTEATGVDVVDWATFEGTAEARYVKVTIKLNGIFAFLDEVEVYGSESTGTPDASKAEDETSSEAPAEPVKEEIAVDGKLDDSGWVKANFKDITPKNGSVQSGSDLGNFKFSYAVRSDDKNVYVAIKTNAGVKNVDTSLDGFDKIRVTGTGLRLYIEVDEATKKFDRLVDVLVEDGKAVGYLAKEKTDAYTVAMVTSDKETVFEFALSIEKMGIKDSFKMAVSYCDVFGEKFDVLNDHTYNTSDNSDAPWGVDTNYITYKVADLKLSEYVPETSKPAETTSSEAPAATSSKAPATSSTSKPGTGDEGVIVFALLAVVAVAGAVVAVRKRG